jgi:hypothetical protein
MLVRPKATMLYCWQASRNHGDCVTEPYKIILVDDEDEVRGRISSKISAESGFLVVGTARYRRLP